MTAPSQTPPEFLFVMGCPRSGTSFVGNLLNLDSRIVLGQERFQKIPGQIRPYHFSEHVFFNPTRFETRLLGRRERDREGRSFSDRYEVLRERWRSGTVRYIGDKFPNYSSVLPHLSSSFSGSRFIFLLRDLNQVASSFNVRAENPADAWPEHNDYRAAPKFWNDSITNLREYVDREGSERVFIILFERFYAGEIAYLEALLGFLGLDVQEAVLTRFIEKTGPQPEREKRRGVLTPEMVKYLDQHRDRDAEQWARELAEQ